MRNPMVALLLAVLSSSATAAWIEFTDNERMKAYVDPTTIRRSGNTVKMWELHDQKKPRNLGSKLYQSMRVLTEYDCAQENFRSLYTTFHSEPMANGDLIYMPLANTRSALGSHAQRLPRAQSAQKPCPKQRARLRY